MSVSLLSMITLVAHIGGLPTRARYEAPIDVGQLGDQSYSVVWMDGDLDPTGQFSFYYQQTNHPPNTQPLSSYHVGVAIAEAQNVLITDTVNQFAWDTSAVPAGSYFVYEVTEELDMSLPPAVSMSPGPVTVQHAGDPLWPAVVVAEPDGLSDTVDQAFAVAWRGSGSGTLTATLSYGIPMPNGAPDPNNQPILVAANLPMVETAPGSYSGCFEWDVSAVAEGFYWVLVEVTDEGSRTHKSYAKGMVIVSHSPGISEERCAPAPRTDAGPTADADPGIDGGGSTCECTVGTRSSRGQAPVVVMFGLALLAVIRRRR